MIHPLLVYATTSNPSGLQYKPALHHGEITITGRKRVELLLLVDHLKKNLLIIHPTAKDFHYMWKRPSDKASRCIAEAKEYNKKRRDKFHMEPYFKEGDQVLVFTLTFKNLKGPQKMRDSFVGRL
ncbi:hypothetical protein O181_033698 [Austropuccinia psidii MF-1]|uniref:Uncharacterized protein n=1 Tax=Austropuccinia psidii MF-1 TaxID=1389203 RepID=A0A9Q3D206_9BASI|nr:hypothetical protein [Austropuccinia psidii MF-1]